MDTVRKLTNRQVAVLAAIERIGWPTLEELRRELSALAAREITLASRCAR